MEKQTHTAEDLMAMVSQLPIVERVRFHKSFKDSPQNGVEMDEYLTEQRFSSGRVCPICGGTHVQRNGRRRNGTHPERWNAMPGGTGAGGTKGGCPTKSVKGIFHIQHLNAYHTKLKAFVASFKGVSSKYLNNYLVWNNAVEHKGGSLREKATNILNFATSALFEETCLAVPMRPPLPILAKNQS